MGMRKYENVKIIQLKKQRNEILLKLITLMLLTLSYLCQLRISIKLTFTNFRI